MSTGRKAPNRWPWKVPLAGCVRPTKRGSSPSAHAREGTAHPRTGRPEGRGTQVSEQGALGKGPRGRGVLEGLQEVHSRQREKPVQKALGRAGPRAGGRSGCFR